MEQNKREATEQDTWSSNERIFVKCDPIGYNGAKQNRETWDVGWMPYHDEQNKMAHSRANKAHLYRSRTDPKARLADDSLDHYLQLPTLRRQSLPSNHKVCSISEDTGQDRRPRSQSVPGGNISIPGKMVSKTRSCGEKFGDPDDRISRIPMIQMMQASIPEMPSLDIESDSIPTNNSLIAIDTPNRRMSFESSTPSSPRSTPPSSRRSSSSITSCTHSPLPARRRSNTLPSSLRPIRTLTHIPRDPIQPSKGNISSLAHKLESSPEEEDDEFFFRPISRPRSATWASGRPSSGRTARHIKHRIRPGTPPPQDLSGTASDFDFSEKYHAILLARDKLHIPTRELSLVPEDGFSKGVNVIRSLSSSPDATLYPLDNLNPCSELKESKPNRRPRSMSPRLQRAPRITESLDGD